MDRKRGQVTLFIILGIVIVAIVVLLMVFREPITDVVTITASIEDEMKDINKEISTCLVRSSDGPINTLALQGGYLSPSEGTFRLWNDTRVSYLCYNMAGTDVCMNRLLTIQHMEEQLEEAIRENLRSCVDVHSGSAKFEVITKSDFDVNVQILMDAVSVSLYYPIEIRDNEGGVVKEEEFNALLPYPLGDLMNVVYSVVDAETEVGFFDTLSYMLASQSKFTIYLHKPYPDKIYQAKLREDDFTFQFAVEGEPS